MTKKVHVRSYTKKDGTKVKSYNRDKPKTSKKSNPKKVYDPGRVDKIIEKVDKLTEMIYDSGLGFESKIDYVSDKNFSIRNIENDIRSGNFEGAEDKLNGLNAYVYISSDFEELSEEIIDDLDELE